MSFEEASEPGPPIMVQGARPLLEGILFRILGAGMLCRIDVGPWPRYTPLWPAICQTPGEISQCLDELANIPADDTSAAAVFPVEFWLFPLDRAADIEELLEAYVEEPMSWCLWRRLLNSGIVWVSLFQDKCSVATDCERVDRVFGWVKEALVQSGIPFRWEE